MLPVYIKGNVAQVLKDALNDSSEKREITIVIGDLIDYKEKTDLETAYRKRFSFDEF